MKFTSPEDAISFLRKCVASKKGAPSGITLSTETCAVLADLIEELADDTVVIELGEGEELVLRGETASFVLQQSVSEYINNIIRRAIDEHEHFQAE